MALLAKKRQQATSEKTAARGGKSLIGYFVPIVLLAVVLVMLVAILAYQNMQSSAEESARSAAQSVATAVAARIEGAIQARRDLLILALSDGRAAAALTSGDSRRVAALEAELPKRVPGLLQIRLLPPDASKPDPSGAAPLSYAGLDMLRRTIDSNRPSAAEVHQLKSAAPYLALSQPVYDAERAVGIAFAAWDMRFITELIESSPMFQGRLQLVQGGTSGYALAKGPGRYEGAMNAGIVDVPETIWQISFGLDPDPGGFTDVLTMLILIGVSTAALLLAVFLQWRMLSRDLRADMSTVVGLGEAILRGENSAVGQARVASSSDAIALLGEYTRQARGGAATPPPARQPVPAVGVDRQSPRGVEVEEITDPAELLSAGAGTKPTIEVPESLFRAYDIRGIVGEALTPALAELLGQGIAGLVREQGGERVCVARDSRLSSPQLTSALIRGLNAGGCDVLDIGQAPTPLLYFAMQTQQVQAGVMVTGSHNPSNYNGFKIVVGDRVLDGDDLLAMRQRLLGGVFTRGNGIVDSVDLLADYVNAVLQEVQLARPLKVVVDAGNGVAGDLAIATFEGLGCEVVPLFCEPDGNFPNHHPDPGQADNLAALMLEVQAQEADLGVAFDGDGDRLGLVDNAGNLLWPDTVLMLLAGDILGRHPGVDILYDVKSSRHLASFILGHGGRPIMWKSGHSRMRAKMLETGALLGGEFSGHLFIKERWFGFDDAIYAAARVMEIVALEARSTSELFAELPSSPATPEYQLLLEEGQSRELMRALDAHKVFDDARLVELDGLRVEFANGWGLIRPSNTTPSLTFRFEADDEGALEEIKARFRDLLRRVAPDMHAPF